MSHADAWYSLTGLRAIPQASAEGSAVVDITGPYGAVAEIKASVKTDLLDIVPYNTNDVLVGAKCEDSEQPTDESTMDCNGYAAFYGVVDDCDAVLLSAQCGEYCRQTEPRQIKEKCPARCGLCGASLLL